MFSISVASKKKQIWDFFVTVSVHSKFTEDANIVIRSPSGDTDIIIIGVSLLDSDHILIENGTEKK